MDNKLKINRNRAIEKILPLLWNSYVHMFESRKNRTQTNLNFLLIIVSFLPVICIMLSDYFKEDLFLFPIIFQFISLLIILKSFYLKAQQIPWLQIDETIKNIDSQEFDIKLFASLKAAEDNTWVYRKELDNITQWALFFIIFSIFLIILSFIFMFFDGNKLLYISTIILIIIFIILMLYYYKKPKYNYKKKEEGYFKILSKWIHNK